jgi:hypothetical protein
VNLDQQMGIDQAVRQLMEATEAIDQAKEQIQQAFQLIAKFSDIPENKPLRKAKEKI